jgi:hypothetical protein
LAPFLDGSPLAPRLGVFGVSASIAGKHARHGNHRQRHVVDDDLGTKRDFNIIRDLGTNELTSSLTFAARA